MKYNIITMSKAYKENENLINAYINKEPIEYFSNPISTIMGLTADVFLILYWINILIFIYALYILVKNWKKLSNVSRIIGILGLVGGFFGFLFIGPLITIIIVKI